ncbi:MAG: M12 family metallopeptidase [Bdellovibrionales bacterium]|nr:M12 family metallopeptidase [Bdellovibrionales bacterium]
MKKYKNIILLTSLLFLFWWWRAHLARVQEKTPPEILPQQLFKKQNLEKPADVLVKEKKVNQTQLLLPKVVKEINLKQQVLGRQPEKGFVEFRVPEQNLAVAFGDIVLGKVQADHPVKKGLTPSQQSRLWPSAEIPYAFGEDLKNKAVIERALLEFQKNTPIRFVPESGQTDLIVFVPAQGICASYLGKLGGAQPIYLSDQCGVNEVLHELMHALGFVHEHSRVDRDQYLEIFWNNIDPEYWSQFWMVPDEYVHDYLGSVFSFDPHSIMLYDSTAFAKSPDLITIGSKIGDELLPSRGTLSPRDRERIQYLYGQ